MPTWGPIDHRKLVAVLRHLGFDGPFSGGKHRFMVKGTLTIRVPNPHGSDIGLSLLTRILRQAGVSREDWEGCP